MAKLIRDENGPDLGRETADGWRPAELHEVFGESGTKTPYRNRDTQGHRRETKPLPADDVALPYLKVGRNVLDPEMFRVACRKLIRAPKVRQEAMRAGDFVIAGLSGAVKIHRAEVAASDAA